MKNFRSCLIVKLFVTTVFEPDYLCAPAVLTRFTNEFFLPALLPGKGLCLRVSSALGGTHKYYTLNLTR